MRIHTCGDERAPVIIMLPGSFCNADTMTNIIAELEAAFRILTVDYNGQYAGSEKPFTSRQGEAEEIIRYLREQAISTVALVYGQSMGGEMGMELIAQCMKNGIAVHAAFFDGGPFLHFPKFVSRLLGNKFKTIVGNLRGKTLEEALRFSQASISVPSVASGSSSTKRASCSTLWIARSSQQVAMHRTSLKTSLN